jgi:deoxycytidine triphosphate deaminase
MILSDRVLRQRLRDRSIVVEPLADLELQLQPASIDLRLGREFRRAVKRGPTPSRLAEDHTKERER